MAEADTKTPAGIRGLRGHPWRVAWLTVAVLLVALVLCWDWDWFRGPVERRVGAATGRTLEIGHLEVDLGRVVVIKATDLSFSNAGWSPKREMARADLLRLEVPAGPWLRGAPTLQRVDVVRPTLVLERNERGDANWKFAPDEHATARPSSRRWTYGDVRVHDGRLDVSDVPLNTDLRLTVDSAPVADDAAGVRLLLRGSGRYRGHAFQLNGWADSPVALLAGKGAAYQLDLSARAGATRGRAYGALRVPLDVQRFKLMTELRGDNLDDLYPLIGLAIPSSPPYRIAGRFERDGRTLRMSDFEGRVGDSDVRGSVAMDLSGTKPRLTGRVASDHLDIDDIGGLIGLPPSVKEGETASPQQREEAQRRAASPTLLPDKAYNLAKLASMNADLDLDARKVDAGKWPLHTLAAHVKLEDSVLQVESLRASFAGGRIDGRVRLDARKSPIDAALDMDAKSIDLVQLMPHMQPPNVGTVGARVQLRGTGNSVAAMLGSSDGEAQIGMGKGRFSNLLLELAGLDVAESLKFLIGKDHTVKLRCAYGDFGVEDGVVHTRSMAFDTTDTLLLGKGSVNLDDEALDIELRTQPKDFSPVSLRGPLEIGGTFKHPKVLPKAKPLLGRVAAAAALYAIAPPAALLALIETGPGENIDCGPHGPGGEQTQLAGGAGKAETKKKDEDKKSRDDKAEADEPRHDPREGHPLK